MGVKVCPQWARQWLQQSKFQSLSVRTASHSEYTWAIKSADSNPCLCKDSGLKCYSQASTDLCHIFNHHYFGHKIQKTWFWHQEDEHKLLHQLDFRCETVFGAQPCLTKDKHTYLLSYLPVDVQLRLRVIMNPQFMPGQVYWAGTWSWENVDVDGTGKHGCLAPQCIRNFLLIIKYWLNG